MSQLRHQHERVSRNDINVVVVTFEDAENALNYKGETNLDWPVAIDSSRELYTYYGLTKAGFWDLWGFSTWKIYIREIFKGNFPKPARHDIHQRGGDVLLSPEGMVKMHHISRGPADRPKIEDVLRLVEQENAKAIPLEDLHNLKN